MPCKKMSAAQPLFFASLITLYLALTAFSKKIVKRLDEQTQTWYDNIRIKRYIVYRSQIKHNIWYINIKHKGKVTEWTAVR